MPTKLNSMFLLFFVLVNTSFLYSCSYFYRKEVFSNILATSKKEYLFKDKSGEFILLVEKGLSQDQKKFITKKQIVLDSNNSNNLEKSINISQISMLDETVYILQPEISQHTVWLEKEKYFSQIKVDFPQKKINVFLKSPEERWDGNKEYPFPENAKVLCFFGRLVLCAKTTGFIKKATSKKTGQMNFHIIWDGFPFFQEQYLNIPNNPFSSAALSYGGTTKDGNIRFNLNTANQTIHYVLDSELQLIKTFWIPQGLSILQNKEN